MAALIAAFALPAFAQDTTAAQCTADADAMNALYQKFLANYKGTPDQQKTASDTGHEYLTKYGNCPDEASKKIATFIQNWVSKYDVAYRNYACTDAVNKKDYAGAFQACQVILNAEPDNLDTLLLLSAAGLSNAASQNPNKGLYAQTVTVSRHAADLLESGKTPSEWKLFPNRDEALGFLDYTQGVVLFDSSPADAAAAFQKAAQSNSKYKREPSTYTYLGTIYEKELAKLIDEYKAAFPPGQPIPDEKKAQYDQMFAQITKVQYRILDAYARAASYMNADPKADAARKKAVMDKVTAYYKATHNDKDDGLPQYVANVTSTPLMLPGQEPTPPPTTPATTTTTGTDGNGAKPASTPPPATKPPVSKSAPATRGATGH
jgi:uncharacterized protein